MSSQEQTGGDGSVNIQAGTVNLGVTYSEAREIAIDVFKTNFLELGRVAKETTEKRALELLDGFLSELKKRKPEAITAMSDPDMQYSLYTAQKEYARSGDKDVEELLINLLVERAGQPNRNLMQIVLNESLGVAAKLTNEQLNILTLIFLLRHTTLKKLHSATDAVKYIDQYYEPFLDPLTTQMANFLHLEYSGCMHLSPGFRSVSGMWGSQNIELFRVLYSADTLLKETGVVERWLVSVNPKIEKLLSVWNKCIMKCYSLTNIGKIIGNTHFRSKTGRELDQVWDRSLSEERHWSIGHII